MHRFLAGEPAPYQAAFWTSRVCEEFHIDPMRADAVMAWAPAGWLEEVIEARHYADTYHQVMAASKPSDVPSSPLVDLVREIELDRADKALRAKQRKDRARG